MLGSVHWASYNNFIKGWPALPDISILHPSLLESFSSFSILYHLITWCKKSTKKKLTASFTESMATLYFQLSSPNHYGNCRKPMFSTPYISMSHWNVGGWWVVLILSKGDQDFENPCSITLYIHVFKSHNRFKKGSLCIIHWQFTLKNPLCALCTSVFSSTVTKQLSSDSSRNYAESWLEHGNMWHPFYNWAPLTSKQCEELREI